MKFELPLDDVYPIRVPILDDIHARLQLFRRVISFKPMQCNELYICYDTSWNWKLEKRRAQTWTTVIL